MKKLFFLWALLLSCTLQTLAHDFEVDGIYYKITNRSNRLVEVTYSDNGNGAWSNTSRYSNSVVIPATVSHNDTTYSVVRIGDDAFSQCSRLTSVVIPDAIVYIGRNAFSGCSGLTEVIIPNSITKIRFATFADCTNLALVVLPDNLLSIDYSSFLNCTSITSITIPDQVTEIGPQAFYGCTNLTTIVIPNSVESIHNSAFNGCSSLIDVIIGSNITMLGAYVFDGCCNLKEITCRAQTPPTMEHDVFRNVPQNIPLYVPRESISAYKNALVWKYFTNIKAFEEKYIEVNNIYYNYLGGDSVEVTFKGESHDYYTHEYTDSIIIPSTIYHDSTAYRVTSIRDHSFYDCSKITFVSIGDNITTIGNYAFSGCLGLTSIEWNVKRCGNFEVKKTPFYYYKHSADNFDVRSQITSFTFGDSVEYIPAYLCKGMTAIESIKIPNSATEMGESAFEGCTKIRTLHIGNGLTEFPSKAFAGCTGLLNLTVRAEMPPYVQANTFENVSRTLLVHVPCTSVGYYKASYYWNEFTNYQESFLLDFLVRPADPTQGSTLIAKHPTCDDITATFKASANSGYVFKEWNDGNTDNPRTVEVVEDVEYVATFTEISDALVNISNNGLTSTCKILENGTIYILRNGEKYMVDGRRVE